MKIAYFAGIAKLMKESREKTPWSQTELAALLKMKNGQFISNIERGLCGLPSKHAPQVCQILKIDPEVMIETMLSDYKKSLLVDFKTPETVVNHAQ